jgi:Ankyrin repeats (3 copies)
MMNSLLNHGHGDDLKNSALKTAWSTKIGHQNEKITDVLLAYVAEPGITDIFPTAASDHTNLVRFLLRNGFDPSIHLFTGWAHLHWAAINGNLDCYELLLDAGVVVSGVSDQVRFVRFLLTAFAN